MKSLLSCLLLSACLAVSAVAQSPVTTPNGSKSDATQLKIRQIDILVQVLPLTIRKEQFHALLGAIEFARAKQREIEAMEDADLAKIDPEITAAVVNGLTKGTYPPRELQLKAAKLYRDMAVRHQVFVNLMVDSTLEKIKTIFDAGQLKVMENSLDPYSMDPSIKKDSLKPDDKIRFFVQQIILDPVAYDVLIKLETGTS